MQLETPFIFLQRGFQLFKFLNAVKGMIDTMKKKILAILLSVSIVFSAVSVAIAAPSDPVSIQSASYTQTAPVVDGEKEDAYKSATPILIDQGIEQEYVTGNDYATASAYALFDDEYMYVLVEVNDPTPKFNRDNEEIKRDVEGVNFYIDLLNTAETDYLPGTRDPIAGEQGRIQTNFIAKESGDAFYTGGSNNLNSYVMTDGRPFTGEFTAALKQTSVGYNVELKVKMSANLKKRISTVKNPAIGFGIQLNDDKDDSYAGDNSGRDGVLVNDMGVHGEWYSWEDACQGSKGFPDVTLRNTAPVTVGTTVTGGTLSVDVEAEGIIGQTVNITAAPDEGKRLQSILVNGTPIKGTSFALPAAGAVVTAVFVDKSEVTIPKEDEKGIPNFMAGFGTALLDGQKDAAYSAGETVIVNTDHTGTVMGPDSGFANAEATTIFDGEYLYVFVEVTDPTPKYNEANLPIVRDVEGVNFFFDFLNNEEGDAAYGANSPVTGEQGRIQTSFIAKKSGDAAYDSYPYVMTDGRGFSGDFATKLVQTAKGYNVEMRVHMSSQLKKRLANEVNPSIGLGIQLNDDTNDSYSGDNSGREKVMFSFVGIDGEWNCSTLPYGGSRGFPNMYLLNEEVVFHTVTVSDAVTGGTITPDLTKAAAGAVVSLTVTPDSGMVLKNGSLKINGQTINQKTFIMPDSNVTITAEFETRSYDNDPNTIKIVSQNVLNDAVNNDYDHGNQRVTNTVRAARMGELLGNQIHADSIGFQEVVGGGRGWAKLLATNFPDYDYVGFGRDFTGSNDTIREDYANDVSSGEATPIFYLREKYDLVESGTWWISKTPGINPGGIHYPEDKEATWNAQYKMTCTWAVLRNKESGKMYAHINSHLDPGVENARTEGMKVVVRKINDLAYAYGETLPIAITADWNCDQYSDAYQVMVSNDQVKIADGAYCLPEEKVINWGPSYHDFGGATGLGNTPPIDIAFITSDNARVTHYEILKQPVDVGDGSGEGCLSDHYGIYMTFTPGESVETIRPVPEPEEGGTKGLTAAFGTADIDGTKDNVYNKSKAAKVNVGLNGYAVSEDEQATAVVSTIYDQNYLYCFAEVKDPTPSDKVALCEPEKDDISEGVAFFLDFLNTPESDELYQVAGEQGGIRIGFAALTNQSIVTTERAATMPYTYAAVKTDVGYNIELRVELSDSLKSKIGKDQDVAIGIGFQINDDTNNDGVRNAVCFSDEKINYEWLPDQPDVGGCKGFQDILLLGQNSSSSDSPSEPVEKPSSSEGGTESGGSSEGGTESGAASNSASQGTATSDSNANSDGKVPVTGSSSKQFVWIAVAVPAAAALAAGAVIGVQRKTSEE